MQNKMDINPETFSTLPPAEQDRIMREWLWEFSRDELLIIKHLIDKTALTKQSGKTTAHAGNCCTFTVTVYHPCG